MYTFSKYGCFGSSFALVYVETKRHNNIVVACRVHSPTPQSTVQIYNNEKNPAVKNNLPYVLMCTFLVLYSACDLLLCAALKIHLQYRL